eukprot:99192_1
MKKFGKNLESQFKYGESHHDHKMRKKQQKAYKKQMKNQGKYGHGRPMVVPMVYGSPQPYGAPQPYGVPPQQPHGGFPLQQPHGGGVIIPPQQPQGGFPLQQPQGGFPLQQPQGGCVIIQPQQPQGGFPLQQPQGGFPLQQPQGGFPFQQPQGGFPLQQPQGGFPLQQPQGGGVIIPPQQPQIGFPLQQTQGGFPLQQTSSVPGTYVPPANAHKLSSAQPNAQAKPFAYPTYGAQTSTAPGPSYSSASYSSAAPKKQKGGVPYGTTPQTYSSAPPSYGTAPPGRHKLMVPNRLEQWRQPWLLDRHFTVSKILLNTIHRVHIHRCSVNGVVSSVRL